MDVIFVDTNTMSIDSNERAHEFTIDNLNYLPRKEDWIIHNETHFVVDKVSFNSDSNIIFVYLI